MLHEPARHEALCHAAWDAPRARAAVRAIVRDIEQSRLPEGHWPLHALDRDPPAPRSGFKSLYMGSAGLLWALWYLQREGAVELQIDPAADIRHAEASYQEDPDNGEIVPSYLLGEVGILLVLWRLTGAAAAADRLAGAVRANITNPANDAVWAAPGTMGAAWHLWQATGQARWRTLWLDNAEHVFSTLFFDERAGCHLWTQIENGRTVQYFGAGHGFAGNVHALLKGAGLLDAGRREMLFERAVDTLGRTAMREDGAANWPPGTYVPRPDGLRLPMQWCHGAPGIVTALADFPQQRFPEMDALLVAAGHAVWRAGPLAKGHGLCHGTAGNGHAFLALHQRTGDALWLERARAFAMHALAQQEAQTARHGGARCTLWTGDAGLAVYLWSCLQGRAGLPGLDLLL